MNSETTYTSGISHDKGNAFAKNDNDERKHLKGSINFGSH